MKGVIDYSLKFSKNENDVKIANLNVHLLEKEIDTLAFLFSKYFDQKKYVVVKGLTFHTEFSKCIDFVKQNLNRKQQNSDVTKLFTMFLNHEFMNQVRDFKEIMHYLQKYYKPIVGPSISAIAAACNICSLNQLACLACKSNYVSAAITQFDTTIQQGWDIFLRPMFGLPLLLFVLIKTDYENKFFTSEDLITNCFVNFLRNILCDKTSEFTDRKTVQPLIDECKRATLGMNVKNLEMLLVILKGQHTLDIPLFAPFKKFMLQLCLKTKIKNSKINKIASVVFTGFYLRLYMEASVAKLGYQNNVCFNNFKLMTPFEMEIRNVCRFIMNKYNDEKFETFMMKLASIKEDLNIEQYIVTEEHIRKLMNKHKIDEDFALLLQND
ncbi:p45/p48 [Cryptophlebia peltastica nucleopolyhedrovirus]|uniref:p45/p48 n=1 Tax=Cryptophlebia peltastica nucleopolyhedrovirus TaxID=2304025 RepID=A0A346RNV0_9ABAC|nr:p45/p48 [Cryptophlebia peltastica nucleopolyhedrovirus]AXS67747.1 p45/p48 [Cryptophlebia peltastica nucleopolyhedrovirus]